MASEMGASLKPIGLLNANGEVLICAEYHGQFPSKDACGGFGENFAKALNAFRPQCGVHPGATLHAFSGWCYLNHFDMERMGMCHYETTQQA